MHVSVRRRAAGLGAAVMAGAMLVALPAADVSQARPPQTTFQQINLVSDQPGHAAITDPNLVNAWGLSHTPTSPLWVSDNGADVATLYAGGVGGAPPSIVPLVVGIPGGEPTGQVYNDTGGFVVPGTTSPALFIFDSEAGIISAWNGSVSPRTEAVQVAQVPDAVYKGLALVHSPFGPLLLATNFHNNSIDVFDSSFTQLPVNLLFTDPRLPRGYAPFNVAEIGDLVYVTYAKQDADRHDDVAGPGHGFIDVYTNYGVFLYRFASRHALNSPWGLTIAPASFGTLAGDLLVGNFGDGLIHAYNTQTGRLEGTLTGAHHRPIRIDGLWALLPGTASSGGTDSVWFSAGPDSEAHGLLGLLRPNSS